MKKEAKRFAKKTAGMWRAKANNSPGSAGTSEDEGDGGEEATKARGGSQEVGHYSFMNGLAKWTFILPPFHCFL